MGGVSCLMDGVAISKKLAGWWWANVNTWVGGWFGGGTKILICCAHFADIQDARGHCELASEHLVWRVLPRGHRLPKILAGTDLILILMCNYQI